MPYPHLPRAHQRPSVQTNSLDCCATHGRATDDTDAISAPSEMVVPAVAARVEKGNHQTRSSVNGLRARLFVIVAPEATPAQVVRIVGAAASMGDEMVHRELVPGEFSARATILAESP